MQIFTWKIKWYWLILASIFFGAIIVMFEILFI